MGAEIDGMQHAAAGAEADPMGVRAGLALAIGTAAFMRDPHGLADRSAGGTRSRTPQINAPR